jgi:hypothetical protein
MSGEDQLAGALEATLSPDGETRRAAEAALEAGAAQPGFALALARLAAAGAARPEGVRQLAAVLLRRHVRERWDPEAPRFRPPGVSAEEKAQVRAVLPAALGDASSKVATAAAMAVAEAARWDGPEGWPELLPGLVAAITDRGRPALVRGAVACFGMLVDELDEEQVLAVAPVLLPELLRLAGDSAAPADLRRRAFGIFRSTVEALEAAARAQGRGAVRAALAPALGPWMAAAAAALAEAAPPGGAGALRAVQREALGCLVRVVPPFGKLAAPHLPAVMAAGWRLLVALAPAYQAEVVEAEDEEAPAEGEASLEELLAELLEFVLTLLGSPRAAPLLAPRLGELCALALGYMQATGAQAARWEADPGAFAADEEADMWSARASGEMLLDEVLEAAGDAGLAAFAGAAAAAAAGAAAARAAGAPGWWRAREALLLALGAVAPRLLELARAGARLPPAVDPAAVLAALAREDFGAGAPPLLAARALWLVAKLAPGAPPGARPALLAAAAAAVAPGAPPPVRAGGCQALAALARRGAGGAPAAELAAVSDAAFPGLAALLATADEEALHLVLEAAAALARADPPGAARWEAALAPAALRAWIENVADPLVAEDAFDLLAALAAAPGALPALHARALPTLCAVVCAPAGANPPLLVAACLELLAALAAPAAPEAAAALAAAAAPAALRLAAAAEDEEVAAAATALLRTLLQVGGAAALSWTAAPPDALAAQLVAAAEALLRPGLPDRACRNAGGLALALLRAGAPTDALLAAAARRLAAAEDPGTVQSLLAVLAHAARADAGALVGALAAAGALAPAMAKWCERQVEVRTPYDIRLTTTALGALLACPHPALDGVTVQGRRVEEAGGGGAAAAAIRTRSRAAAAPERFAPAPLRAKLLSLLADAFIEAAVQEEEADEGGDGGSDASGSDGGEDWAATARAAGGAGAAFAGFGGWGEEEEEDEDGLDLEAAALANVDPLEAARRRSDPLAALDVGAYVAELFRSLAGAAPEALRAALAELTPTQQAAVARIWQ